MKTKTLLVLLLSLVSIVVWFFRVVFTHWLDIGLVWNLFLAWIPLLLIKFIEMQWVQQSISKKGLIMGFMIWLLFFPNAPYLITDLKHIKEVPDHLLWYDSIMYFLFAFAGLLAGLYAMLKAHHLVAQIWKPNWAWLFVIGSTVISSYGLYLGRYGRWNSWDIITNPFSLIKYSIIHLQYPLAIQTTLVFSFVLSLLYVAFWLYAGIQTEKRHRFL